MFKAMLREAELVRERVVEDGGGAHAGREYWESTGTLRAEIERAPAPSSFAAAPKES